MKRVVLVGEEVGTQAQTSLHRCVLYIDEGALRWTLVAVLLPVIWHISLRWFTLDVGEQNVSHRLEPVPLQTPRSHRHRNYIILSNSIAPSPSFSCHFCCCWTLKRWIFLELGGVMRFWLPLPLILHLSSSAPLHLCIRFRQFRQILFARVSRKRIKVSEWRLCT